MSAPRRRSSQKKMSRLPTLAVYDLIPKSDIDEIFAIYENRKVTDFKEYKNLEGFLEKLYVDKEYGLDVNNSEDLKKRRNMYSVIEDQEEKQKSIFEYIWNALEDLMLRLLIVVAIVSMILGIIENGWKKGWVEGASILISVVIVVFIQSYTDYKKQRQFAVLHKIQSSSEHETKRNGHINLINVKEWVVGDIIQITPGCVPKADGILLSCDIPIQVDEKSINGENDVQNKDVGCCIFEGCPIVDGYGEMVILRLGKDSNQGRIKSLMNKDEQEATPLQDKLELMAEQIGIMAIWAASITFITLISFEIYHTVQKDKCFMCINFWQEMIRHLMIGFGIVIMAIPEGLPLSVTIALAYSVHQMYEEKNLVKKLKSCETMGGVSDICTDKTGTLTYGNMILKKILINLNTYNVENLENNNSATKELLIKIIQNTSKAIVDEDDEGEQFQKGNITEIGLIKWVLEQEQEREYYNLQKVREFPFTSKNRCSGTIVNVDGTQFLYIKGQPDTMIPSCSKMYLNDEIVEFDAQKKQKVEKSIEEYSAQAYRGLVFAIKQVEGKFTQENYNSQDLSSLISQNDLIFVSTCFLQDTVREEVPNAVEMLKQAGVTTRMITGDSYFTAKAVAIQTGIIQPDEDSAITTGYDIAQMDEVNLNLCVDKYKVVAKCNPEQKLKFVKALKSQDKVVAVTGDGTNDAPCFKVADVSFTMGKNGTEIIKDAGDIILIDDNYASIVTACLWGRNIIEGIRKFLIFQLTVNITGVVVSLLGSIVMQESPLSSSQMLWINLIMDTFASLALATDHPNNDLLKRQPYKRNEDLINGYMKRCIAIQCVYQIIVLSFILLLADNIFGVPQLQHQNVHDYTEEGAKHMTIFFHTFVLLQLFNEFNCRDLRRDIRNPFHDIFRNKYFNIVMILSILVQYSLIQFGGQTFKCAKLNLIQHVFCASIGAGGIIIGVIVRIIPESFYDRFALFRDQTQFKLDIEYRRSQGEHIPDENLEKTNLDQILNDTDYGSISMEHKDNLKKDLVGEKNL